jgi:hypothetical protein
LKSIRPGFSGNLRGRDGGCNRAASHYLSIETYLGTTYRFYVRGMYVGAAATRAKALEFAKEALESSSARQAHRTPAS